MSYLALTMTEEEKSVLVEILEKASKDSLIDESRTEAITYREYVQHKEQLITRLLEKLKILGRSANCGVF